VATHYAGSDLEKTLSNEDIKHRTGMRTLSNFVDDKTTMVGKHADDGQ